MKEVINCPDHKDKHASAAIYTRPDGSQWLHCLGCKVSRLFKEGETMAKFVEEEDYDESDYGTDLKQCLNEVELLETLEREKGIDAGMVNLMDGWVTDQGYLGFKYGIQEKEVYRNLLKNDKPRFINSSKRKGLMGEELLDAWEGEEIFLVEGLTDFIKFRYEFGNNVVTSFGSELTEEQAYLLRTNTVFILFDRDYAGYKGAKQAETRLKEVGATPIIIELPNGINLNAIGNKIDVNYLLHKEKDAFKEWLWSKLKKYKTFDDNYVDTFKKKTPIKSYETDIPSLRMTQGGLYIISGAPKTGKSTMGVSLTDHFSIQGGQVLYCNYDSSKDEIIARLASRYTDMFSWIEIEANPSKLDYIPNTEGLLKQCLRNVKIVNGLTIDEIKYCKKYYTHIIVDYIQRIPNYDNDKIRGLERIMDTLSDLASNDGMTIIGISRQSLSGNPYSGSASIPYHAHATMILNKTDNDIVSCNIDVNRKGQTGTWLFKVDYPHQRLRPTKLSEIAKKKMGEQWWGEQENLGGNK